MTDKVFTLELLNKAKRKDKRYKHERNRLINVVQSKVKSLEYQQVTTDVVYEIFDYESYKNGTVDVGLIKRTILQFFHSFERVDNEYDKRRSDYLFGQLINEDGSPEPRKRQSNSDDFFLYLEAILIHIFENKKISQDEKTILKWLQEFGLLTSDQVYHYNLFRHVSKYEKLNEKQKREFSKIKMKINLNIDIEYIPDELLLERVSQKRELTDKEHYKIYRDFTMYIVDILKERFNYTLKKFERNKLINVYPKKYAIEYLTDSNGEVVTITDDKGLEYNTKKVKLSLDEIRIIDDIEKKIIEELGFDNLYGTQKYFNQKFMKEYNKVLSNGIEVNGEIRYFESVFRVFALKKRFTNIEKEKYINSNDRLKVFYESKKKIMIGNYRKEFKKLVDKKSNSQTYYFIEKETKKYTSKVIGDKSKFEDKLHQSTNRLESYHNKFKELSSKYINELFVDDLTKKHTNIF